MTVPDTQAAVLEHAVKIFRPLLKDLKLQELESLALVFTDNYKAFIRQHMTNCVIVAKRHKFTKENYKGVFIWQYDRETKMYALYIIINDNMYNSDENDGIYRKAVTTHEFVHCVAALQTLARLNTEVLIERQHEKLSRSFHAIEQSDLKNLMTDLTLSMINPDAAQLLTFSDSHFRTGDEDFKAKYSDLYRNLLLSYDLFREYFTDELYTQFAKLCQESTDKAAELFTEIIRRLAKEKRLSVNFIVKRMTEEFIPRLLKRLKEKQ